MRRRNAVQQPVLAGMAVGDGILIKTSRAWAVARRDGTIETGALETSRARNIPVLRFFVSLADSFGKGMSRRAKRRTNDQAVSDARLMLVVAAPIALAAVGGLVVPRTPLWLAMIVIGLVTLGLIRAVAPSSLLRLHGAEHKAIAAFERLGRVPTVDEAAGENRTHERCGTNILFIGLLVVPPLASTPWAIPAMLLGAELLRAVALRWPGRLGTRLLTLGGRVLQRYVTTSEPTAADLAVGVAAVAACLDADRHK